MMMMEKISEIQRKHATITRPGKIRWEMSMSIAMPIVKLISMKIKDKKYQSHLPNPGELPHSLSLTHTLSLSFDCD